MHIYDMDFTYERLLENIPLYEFNLQCTVHILDKEVMLPVN